MRVGLAVTALLLAAWTAAYCQDFVYDAGGRRNPFLPIVTPDGRFQKLEHEDVKIESELRLEGIMYDNYGISYAVVDGMVVKVGDMVNGYQVVRIEEKEVVFMREGQEKILDLKTPGA